MAAAKSVATTEKSRGTKAVEEIVSEEIAATDPEVGEVAVDILLEEMPSTAVVAPELTAPAPSAAVPPTADQAVLGLPAGVAKEVSPVLATGTLLSNVIASGLGEKTAPAAVPAAPSTRPPMAEKKRVQLPPCSTRDAEETIPVETGVVPDPLATTSVPFEDMIVEEVPKVDPGRLGATMSMLQDVIRSVEEPATALGLRSAGLSSSSSGVLAIVEKSKQTTAPGAVLGTAPHPMGSTQRPVLNPPSDLELQRAMDVFRGVQERNHQMEQECARLKEALRVHEVGVKPFAVERADHAVLQEKLESRYKSLNKKYHELKKQEASARNQVIDWRNAHDRVANEAEHLRAALAEAEAACEHQRDRKMQIGVMLAMAMVACRDHAQTLG
uniref:Uncharacterized protein n=2 Tax=Setaria viridis TaxID=4556 RepID=A0A4U6TH27_SETVI|nr:hypothetical protein SEVIR_8G086833v2 [Setaria viridis]